MNGLLTTEDIARKLRLSMKTIYKLLQTGVLRGSKVGHVWRVREQDLEDFITGVGAKPAHDRASSDEAVTVD